MKLWDKSDSGDKRVEAFTAGEDVELDQVLVPFDCAASKAHARMLAEQGFLAAEELTALLDGLDEILALHGEGGFVIRPEDEDCHTAIEAYLTERCGQAGKKIHTARSRNDQVLTAMRLYEKATMTALQSQVLAVEAAIEAKAELFGAIKLPGWTHTRKAMPADIKLWFESYRAGLADDRALLAAVVTIIDQSPLGSAAGFGVPIAIDREKTARELGFKKVQPTMYCQASRGKLEALIVDACCQVMLDLNRIAGDLILFSGQDFGFFRLPAKLCTGSSIMPHKHNPDVLELIRGRAAEVVGASVTLKTLVSGLVSGYHRDLQLSKGPTMRSLETTSDCLAMTQILFDGLEVDTDRCAAALSPDLFATERVYRLVEQGVPFREAYRQIRAQYS